MNCSNFSVVETLVPEWPIPVNVRSLFTFRQGGFSKSPYKSANLALHVGDDINTVLSNRASLECPGDPVWLDQVHSDTVIDADAENLSFRGDASMTRSPGRVLAVMAADCVPIMVTSKEGDVVAVIHAGWRGLANGIIKATVDRLEAKSLIAWLGPAIGPCHYEVGPDVRDRFDEPAFTPSLDRSRDPSRDGWLMDLFAIARRQLLAAGVHQVFGGGRCTYCEEENWFSYRRDGVTGRMAGLIWIT